MQTEVLDISSDRKAESSSGYCGQEAHNMIRKPGACSVGPGELCNAQCIPLGTEAGETRQSLGGRSSGPKPAFTNKFLNLYATSTNKAESIVLHAANNSCCLLLVSLATPSQGVCSLTRNTFFKLVFVTNV